MTPSSDFDTQAAVRPWERINLDNWTHSQPSECDRLRPHYGGDGKWRCDTCREDVKVVAP